MILGAVHRSPGIGLTTEESPKTSARRPSDVQTIIASNGVPFLQMRSVASHSTSGRKKEGIKESAGWVIVKFPTATIIHLRNIKLRVLGDSNTLRKENKMFS